MDTDTNLLIALPPSLPILRELWLYSNTPPADLRPYLTAFGTMAASWPHLNTLALPGVNHDGLVQISQLHNLISLTLDQVTYLDDSMYHVPTPFPALKSIHIVNSLTTFTKILPLLSDSPIEDVTFRGKSSSANLNDEYRSFLRVLVELCPDIPLKSFKLVLLGLGALKSDFMTVLGSLLKYHLLERVSVHFDINIPIQEDDVVHLARAWPNIKQLCLSPEPIQFTINPSRLATLLSFSACTQLCDLDLYFDASSTQSLQESYKFLKLSDRQLQSLTVMRVGKSPINQPKYVAAFLASIIPNLTYIYYYIEDNDLPDEILFDMPWYEVRIHLPLFGMMNERIQRIARKPETSTEIATPYTLTQIDRYIIDLLSSPVSP